MPEFLGTWSPCSCPQLGTDLPTLQEVSAKDHFDVTRRVCEEASHLPGKQLGHYFCAKIKALVYQSVEVSVVTAR